MLLSVIIPVYNGERYLKECIDSVRHQPFKETEIIVVDDGSKDGTQTVCRAYEGEIRVLSQPHRGVGAARNAGFAASRGDWVMFLDADDVLVPDALTAPTAEAIRTSDAEVCAFGFWEGDEKLRLRRREEYKARVLEGQWHIMPLSGYHSAFLVRRTLIERYGLQYPDCRICEDSIFKYSFLYFSRRTRVFSQPLFIYRRHPGSASNADRELFDRYNGAIDAWYALLRDGRFEENRSLHEKYCERRMYETLYDWLLLSLASQPKERCFREAAALRQLPFIEAHLEDEVIDDRHREAIRAALGNASGIRRLLLRPLLKLWLKRLLCR